MPSFVSPGSYVIEKDFSEFAPTLNASVAGLVGFASQGPINKATLVTSAAQLIRTFGRPDLTAGGQGLYAALEVLSKTSALYFVRTATSSCTDASAGVSWGPCPAIYVSGYDGWTRDLLFEIDVHNHAGSYKNPTGDTIRLVVNSLSSTNGGGRTDYSTAYTTEAGGLAIANAVSKIATSDFPFSWVTDPDDVSAGWFVGNWAGSGAFMTASAASGQPGTISNLSSILDLRLSGIGQGHDAFGLSPGMRLVGADGDPSALLGGSLDAKGGGDHKYHSLSSTLAFGGVVGGENYYVRSIYPGSGYNHTSAVELGDITNKGLQVKVTSRNGKNFVMEMYKDGASEENFDMNFEAGSVVDNVYTGKFPENVLNVGETNTTSNYVKGEFLLHDASDRSWTEGTNWYDKLGTGATKIFVGHVSGQDVSSTAESKSTARFCKLIDGNYSLSGGKNGDTDDHSGAFDSNVKAAIIGTAAQKTGIYALDDDSLNISIAAVPGVTEQSVQNALVSLAETSQNFLAVVAPPYGLKGPQAAVNWTNGKGNGRTAAINSSYAAVYWPWLKVFDVWSRTDKWLSPEAFAIGVLCTTDAVADPWFAPAGLSRGRLTKPLDTEIVLNQGDRDVLYSPGECVNPITKFQRDGIVVWGQRTAQRTPTALDRINIRRMMIVLRKMILASTRMLVFEPNDPITWARVQNVLNPMLDDIRRRRGITEFRVLCDETTNTPIRVDRNELWCRILIKPTKTAEVLVFELNLTNQSADLG